MSVWRKKPVSHFERDMKKNDLNRVLTRWGLTSLGIGAITTPVPLWLCLL
jgi:basic amino acid/polyamine antiporter, APA family